MGETKMGKQRLTSASADNALKFFRATAMGRAVDNRSCAQLRCVYRLDVLEICERGIWEHELRQFIPPASLQAALSSLLELGLIEQVESPPPRVNAVAFGRRLVRAASRHHVSGSSLAP